MHGMLVASDTVALWIALCTMFCGVLGVAILKKPLPRLLDAIPREMLSWTHSGDIFIFTDPETESITIKNAG